MSPSRADVLRALAAWGSPIRSGALAELNGWDKTATANTLRGMLRDGRCNGSQDASYHWRFWSKAGELPSLPKGRPRVGTTHRRPGSDEPLYRNPPCWLGQFWVGYRTVRRRRIETIERPADDWRWSVR